MQRALDAARALRAAGATVVRVSVGEVAVDAEFEPEPPLQAGSRPRALRSSERRRLEELEAREARLAEIPGYLEGG